jgi:hypothetical protein
MGTAFREEADLSSGVAERDQVLTEEAHPQRRSIKFAEVSRWQKRHPVLTQ